MYLNAHLELRLIIKEFVGGKWASKIQDNLNVITSIWTNKSR